MSQLQGSKCIHIKIIIYIFLTFRLDPGENKADNTQNVIELANKFMDKVKDLRDRWMINFRICSKHTCW